MNENTFVQTTECKLASKTLQASSNTIQTNQLGPIKCNYQL